MNSIYALHGMFGLPSDWGPFFLKANCPSLFAEPPLPFAAWAKKFNKSVDPQGENILVGYSLGGRLAIHALLQAPELWQGAILISTSLQSRPEKWEKDWEWSVKCENLPWQMLLDEWNAQPVFANTFVPERREIDFNRKNLAAAFQEWSTARQVDLKLALESLLIPIYWIVGERDPTAARDLQMAHPFSKVIVAPAAGHRLQWDNPIFFKQLIEEFQYAYNSPLAPH